jgi:hypothetical protein
MLTNAIRSSECYVTFSVRRQLVTVGKIDAFVGGNQRIGQSTLYVNQ